MGKQIAAAAAAALSPDAVASAHESGRARDLKTTVGELPAALGGRT